MKRGATACLSSNRFKGFHVITNKQSKEKIHEEDKNAERKIKPEGSPEIRENRYRVTSKQNRGQTKAKTKGESEGKKQLNTIKNN